ncbi:pyridoxine/pyridoxamine 5'-phosphate oxidase [Amycolatopsis aidingensis]|uniref:pyridoxine/pyridoxamine 5'-phosphate oxidase n=1 Tax=Amycolatopsis aidingensis TaxID=2842453 RepID=UPI001C0E2C03|nr:pyridoxal 5'-phosphate synthase [Amycolatopsis aidingensis]
MSPLRGWPSFPDEPPDFDPASAPEQPDALFLAWLADAGEYALAPHATVLSTVDSEGAPDARVVILKEVDAAGWQIATSALSPKGRQLGANPRVALTFFWPQRARQVRIRGTATPAAAELSAADFRERPPASKVESLIGNQSEILSDPAELTRAARAAEHRVATEPDPVPAGWTRYLITAESVEFWQGRQDRLHIRLRYTREATGWRTERLWP